MKGTYGVDSPGTVLGLGIGAAFGTVGAALSFQPGEIASWAVTAALLLPLASFGSFLYTTLRGKFIVWQREIRALDLPRGATVLDLGCGRGLVLLQAAKSVPGGSAVGVDLWRSADQTGNSPDTTMKNAEAVGVAEHVDLVTADMCELPFADRTFDAVLSSLAIHNIPTAEGRARAVHEALRVAKSGAPIRIADFRHHKEYAAALEEAGAKEVAVRGLGWRFWYGGPFFRTIMVEARK